MSDSPCRSLFELASEADDSIYTVSTAATSVHRLSVPTPLQDNATLQRCVGVQRDVNQFISAAGSIYHHRHQKELPQTPTMNIRPTSDWSDGDQYWRLFPSPPATMPATAPHWWGDASLQHAQHRISALHSSEAAWDDTSSCVDELITDPSSVDVKLRPSGEAQQDIVDDLRRQVQRLQLALDLQSLHVSGRHEVAHHTTPPFDEQRRVKPKLLFSSLSFAPSSASSSSSMSSSSESTVKALSESRSASTQNRPPPPPTPSHRKWVVNSTATTRTIDHAQRKYPASQPNASRAHSTDAHSDVSLSRPSPTASASVCSDDVLVAEKLESPLPSVPTHKGRTAVTRFVSALKPSISSTHEDAERSSTQITRVSWSHKHTGKMEVPKTNKVRQGPGRGRTMIKSPPNITPSNKVSIQS